MKRVDPERRRSNLGAEGGHDDPFVGQSLERRIVSDSVQRARDSRERSGVVPSPAAEGRRGHVEDELNAKLGVDLRNRGEEREQAHPPGALCVGLENVEREPIEPNRNRAPNFDLQVRFDEVDVHRPRRLRERTLAEEATRPRELATLTAGLEIVDGVVVGGRGLLFLDTPLGRASNGPFHGERVSARSA